ncbi:BamA/TamA family outer membrane protein [candidate division GN15 bacterium]|nr:BamA/TamA family outer membrane protein [candidate division GN15 bacterium]
MTRSRYSIIAILTALALIVSTGVATAQESDYKEYQPRSNKTEYFWIAFDDEVIVITAPYDDTFRSYEMPIESVRREGADLRLASDVRFTPDGLEIKDQLLPYDEIVDTRVREDGNKTAILFLRSDATGPDYARLRRGNMLEPFEDMRIEEGAFVRGFVISINGDIDVFGEVNKDIISLFGNVYVAPEAVARGDVVSITGKVQIARDASVYGIVYTGTQRQAGKSRRFYRQVEETELTIDAYYNRVDGITPLGTFRYSDRDSLLPSVELQVGYAFESKRSRLRGGIEQVIWRKIPMAIGGMAYHELATEDDWVIGTDENNAFTMLFTEDFRDYYERDGGYLYFRIKPLGDLTVETGYRYDETRWFDAERDLWSLFGGDKKFPRNFHTAPEPFRRQGISDIDTSANAMVSLSATYDSRNNRELYEFSGWHFDGRLEWSDDHFSSDFDYRRYRLTAQRYQLIHSRIMVISSVMFGGSDGYTPMHKRFYLGGLGTLRGYKHKEMIGKRFWMGNLEYRFRFPATDFALSVLYDVAQISNDSPLNGDVEVKQSLGAAFYVGDDFRLSLARRLDRGEDNDLQFYARFEQTF